MSIGTILFTLFKGKFVGQDDYGNSYFMERQARNGMRQRRWVRYRGIKEPSKVPPEWHAWLHYIADAPIDATRRSWQKGHKPNVTGTPNAYHPPGSEYRDGRRAPATGDYEPWRPS